MEAIEIVAIIVLVIAIIVLVYYYLLNTPTAMNKLKSYIPTGADAHMSEVISQNTNYPKLNKENDSESVTKRIKVKLNDIDMSGINTDAFSNKLDAFLDEKSDELIKDWSLATTKDLKELEAKFLETSESVDALDKDYQEFKKSSMEFQKTTEDKLNDIDKRIEALEK
ncbi:hypothetical protein [uncultured Methanobrevibacter sp.]|jgi:hypothetical protein|uniref:hypothetical protein n=1 Tax=uncultured Methanobrevibacter sp. TaxID=253161 RepID=UPI0025EA0C5D|nr:hypothetical protein [uncultured Methanobrevibacter sp.]MBQ3414479.1 hypothetical protein [Clostridia bacterium]